MVGDHAVDLLGHPPVERTQPGLDVRDGDAVLGSDQGGGKRRIRVAIDEDGIGSGIAQDRVEGDQHPRGLLGPRPSPDIEVMVRRRQPELAEEGSRHRIVPVLTRVDELESNRARRSGLQRRRLDELGSRPDDAEDAH